MTPLHPQNQRQNSAPYVTPNQANTNAPAPAAQCHTAQSPATNPTNPTTPDPPAPTSQPIPQTTAPNPSQQTNNDPYKILLDHAHVFQRLVKKYPSLPFVLDSIHSQTLPPPTPSSSTTTPSFLQNNNRKRKEPPWSKDVGLRKGANALKKARTDPTDRGDGVREFCDAVLYLLSLGEEGKGKGDGDGDGGPRPVAERAVKEVGEEVRREERRVVEGLLREEEGV
ncbi:hypothetical protein QC761_309120 [Podospora bellae-mahoneyi]|uniref:Uncharacterized protein n=1 Tax=Podospora bellae-mahoneyi TaxID=2093777 RepID=A0ABR0FNM7_9PEZI|nr:hypothetical protein QC761_309120 [Podospora bellae-mahoneyi]